MHIIIIITKSYQITNNLTVNKNQTLSKWAKPSLSRHIASRYIQINAWLNVFLYLIYGRRKKHDILEIQTLSKTKQTLRCICAVIWLQRTSFLALPSPSWRNLRSSIWQQRGACLLCEKAPNCRLFDTHLLPIEQQSKLAMF